MGVYIKELRMPESCCDCPLYNGYGCKATLQMFHPATNIGVRVSSCPLIEVPTPHGDLIDGHKMEFSKEDREDGGETWLWKADTIIPAEE